MNIREIITTACATMALGIPLALAAVIFGGRALVWVLTSLPQG